jgi:hypothetical protein
VQPSLCAVVTTGFEVVDAQHSLFAVQHLVPHKKVRDETAACPQVHLGLTGYPEQLFELFVVELPRIEPGSKMVSS